MSQTMREALRELLAAYKAPYPSAEQGQSAQDAWSARRAQAEQNAEALLSAPSNEQAQQGAAHRLSEAEIEDCIDRANRKFNGRHQGPSGQQATTYDDWKHWLAREVEATINSRPAAAAPPAGVTAWKAARLPRSKFWNIRRCGSDGFEWVMARGKPVDFASSEEANAVIAALAGAAQGATTRADFINEATSKGATPENAAMVADCMDLGAAQGAEPDAWRFQWRNGDVAFMDAGETADRLRKGVVGEDGTVILNPDSGRTNWKPLVYAASRPAATAPADFAQLVSMVRQLRTAVRDDSGAGKSREAYERACKAEDELIEAIRVRFGYLAATAPAGGVTELPDDIRVPLDSLHADALYLTSRVAQSTMSAVRLSQVIRERIDAAKAALAGAAQGAEPVAVRQPLTLEFIDEHIGADEGDREAVIALVREVEAAHCIIAQPPTGTSQGEGTS